MPQAQPSPYKLSKDFLLARPGQYFTSKAVIEALNLKDPDKRRRVGKSLSALADGKSSYIERRQNEDGRYEYAFTGVQPEESSTDTPESQPQDAKPRRRNKAKPAPQKAAKPAQPPQAKGSTSLKKVANFIRAYLELSPEERREAYEWLNEQA